MNPQLLETNCSQFFYLLGGHALADYAWQSPEMSTRKHPRSLTEGWAGPWWWWMVAHSLINGFLVGLILQWWVVGLCEALVHFSLDTAKCLGKLSTAQDQLGHLLSKLVWVWMV